jgi:hypothetical protein
VHLTARSFRAVPLSANVISPDHFAILSLDFNVCSLTVVFCQSFAFEPRDCPTQLVELPSYGVAVTFASQFCYEFCHRRIIHGRAIMEHPYGPTSLPPARGSCALRSPLALGQVTTVNVRR